MKKRTIKILLLIISGIASAWIICGAVFLLYCFNAELPQDVYDIDARIAAGLNGAEIYAEGDLYARLNVDYSAEGDISDGQVLSFTQGKTLGIMSYISLYINVFNKNYIGGSPAEKLARQLFPEASGSAAIRIARRIEEKYGGDVGRVYCNSADFGNGVYGIRAASRYYFGAELAEIDEARLEFLARIPCNAELYGKTPSELAGEGTFSISFNADYKHTIIDENNAYINELRNRLFDELCAGGMNAREAAEVIFYGGIRVYSTLDKTVQDALDKTIVNANAPEYFQISMLICDYSGNILGQAGGIGEENRLNRTQLYKQPGSSIKPISVYLPAFEDNLITYSTILNDVPYTGSLDENGWPQNYNRIYEGFVTAAYALRQSKNTTAVGLADEQSGSALLSAMRERFKLTGLTEDDADYARIALGYLSVGMTLEELALAYQVFGNGGVYNDACYFTKIERGGELIYEKKYEGAAVTDSQTAGVMNRILRSNVILPDGLGNKAALDTVEVIGKTGTTDNASGIVNDTTFVGETPQYIGAVWVGSDEREVEESLSTLPSTTEVWRRVMEKISQEKAEFDIDSELVSMMFCTQTGLIAAEKCTDTETGWYKPENVPLTCTAAHQG